MKLFLLSIFFYILLFFYYGIPAITVVKPAGKPAIAVVAQTPIQKSAFDGTVVVLKKRLSDIERAKADQKATQARIEKETLSLAVRSDSVY